MLLDNNSDIESDTSFVSYAAAIAIILSSKLHETRRQICLVSFYVFHIDKYEFFNSN